MIGTDANTGDFGWLIDNVSFTNVANLPFSGRVAEDGVCVNAEPYVSELDDITVTEQGASDQTRVELSVDTFDHEGDTLTFNWTQTSGVSANLEGTDTNALSFVAPVIGQDETLEFNLAVSDGTSTVERAVTVDIIDVNDAPLVEITGANEVVERQDLTLRAVVTDDDSVVNYQWSQISGTPVEFTSSRGSTVVSFTAPNVSSDENITFRFTAFDDQTSTSVDKVVTVTNRRSGGGGSMNFVWLTLLGLLGLKRRK
jgi:hypothetical protein